MKFHHIGIVCDNIEDQISRIKRVHQVNHQTPIVFDELQQAHLCMLTIEDGTHLELISGEMVAKLLEKGIQYGHVCYEVADLDQTLEQMKANGGLIVSYPKAAKLFDGRRVAFVYLSYGLVELLESQDE